MIASEPPGPMSRAPAACAVVAVFADPAVLELLAVKALSGVEDREGSATKLTVRAGKRGAHEISGQRRILVVA